LPDKIPPDVRDFLRRYIHTVEQLEILLTLRADRGHEWTAPEVFAKVRTSEQSVMMRLAQFAEQGLLVETPGVPATYRYAPRPADLDYLIAGAGEALHTRRVKVLEIIFGSDQTNVADPAQIFADAFRIRPRVEDRR
jgi:hypothetical protein